MSEGVTNERGIEFSSKCFLTASLITPSSSPREDRKRGPRTEWREGGGPVLPNSRDKVQGTERSKLASKKRGEGRGEGEGEGKKEGGNGAAGKRICRLLARFSSLFGQQERLVVLIPVLVRCSGNPHAGKTTTCVSASPSSLSLSHSVQGTANGGEGRRGEEREHTDELSVPFLPLSPCR